jgi:DNA-binding NarL/FixJ family response regulator
LFHKGTMRHASQDEVGIYLVAANRLLREALARVFRAESGFDVVGACAPGPDTEYVVLKSGADLVLLDDFSAARSDLRLVAKLMTAAPALRMIVVGTPETESVFLDSVQAGTIVYELHDDLSGDLISSIGAVLNGKSSWPARIFVSLHEYNPGSGIACPTVKCQSSPAAHVVNPAPRALHFFQNGH